MKKIVAILLCLSLLGCCAAVAETAETENKVVLGTVGSYVIRCRLPEGYKVNLIESDSVSISGALLPEQEGQPDINLSIGFNDSYTQDGKALRMNDVSEEDLAEIRESFVENVDEAFFEERETGLGTKVLVVKGSIGDKNFVDLYSLYNSYEVEVVAVTGSDEPAEEQIQMLIDFFTEMDFVEK